MPKEIFSNNIPQPDQPLVLSKGELSQKFRILKPEEVEKLGLTKNKSKSPERKRETGVSVEQAMEVLGKDVLGPEAIETAFGFTLENVPPIPFSIEELERAKELNQFLILRVDTNGGDPLDMKMMNALLQSDFTANNNGKILNSYGDTDCWYKNEDFLNDTPRTAWALVSKDVVPNSLSKNFLQQTQVIADYLKTDIFRGQELPDAYKEAVEEFETKKAGIQAILTSNWKEAAKQLSELKLNQLVRQSPAETMYDFLVYFKNNKQRLLENNYTWTSRRASVGGLVFVGYFDAAGADVYYWLPGNSDDNFGVAFSRSL